MRNRRILSERQLADKAKNIISSPRHENLTSAVAADIVDVIPIVGDVTNALRVINSFTEDESDRTKALQTLDMLVGVLPGIGTLADLITPTNTIVYLMDKNGATARIPVKTLRRLRSRGLIR